MKEFDIAHDLIFSVRTAIWQFYILVIVMIELNGWQLAKMKKSIPDMSLPWNL